MNARRVSWCRGCRRDTPQVFTHAQPANGTGRNAHHYRCATCGMMLLTLADVHDAEGLAWAVLNEYLRKTPTWRPTSDQKDDLAMKLYGHVWEAFLEWQPELALRFRAYAVTFLRNRIADERRAWIGGSSGKFNWLPKPLAVAVSLDAPSDSIVGHGSGRSRLDEVVTEGALDDGQHSLADLCRAVSGRRREIDEEGARVGRSADEGVAA